MKHIGVLSPVAGGFYFGEILSGIVAAAAAADCRVTLVQSRDAGQTADEVLASPRVGDPVGWAHLDGFITITESGNPPTVSRMLAAGKPVVLVSNDLGLDTACVMTDNRTGVRSAVNHLVEHGHTRIGFVGHVGQTDMRERYEAYCDEMAAHGLDLDPELTVSTHDHVETGGAGAADAVIALLPRMTAAVASTDRVALGLMRVLNERGVDVPHDLALVGFDDVEDGWRSTPPLSTVNQQIQEQGARAAQLLLAELGGEAVEHRRHTAPSTFIPRRSCGCTAGTVPSSAHGADEGRALIDALATHLGRGLGSPGRNPTNGTDLSGVDLDAMDDLIESTLVRLFPTSPSPETVERFAETVIPPLVTQMAELRAAGAPGEEILTYALTSTTSHLAQLGAASESVRAQRLGAALVEQYDVGMSLLGQVDSDPRDLSWLRHVPTRLACLALWEGPPENETLRIASVYDPDGQLTEALPATCSLREIPPASIVDLADPARDQVTFVLPLRGAFGDYGVLCLVGTVDTHAGTGRSTYNHWAALLGAALKERDLIEDVRLNEERYSLAASATDDGLWDWDRVERTCYYSERCQTMLGADRGTLTDRRDHPAERTEAPELALWTERVHPDDHEALRAAMMGAINLLEPFEIEHRLQGPDGEYRWFLCRALPVGEPGSLARRVVGALSDINQRKELEEQLRQGALYDAVTGLPNRRLFLERLRWAVDQRHRDDDASFAVIFLDLDGFKLVNDSLGHLVGDDLLRVVADRLRTDLRTVDTAARFGGDEFAVLLFGLQHEAVLSIVARIQEQIAEPVVLAGHEVSVTASVGIATSATGYTDADEVLRDADIAMYHAKETERGTASVFDPAMHNRATGRLLAQSELRTALLDEQFVMHYQPMVPLDGGPLSQFEALVRWEHPERGIQLPGEFLPVLAETGTIVTLGQWIIDSVCAQLAHWRAVYDGETTVSVNLSHREFWSERLLGTVTGALTRHQVPAHCLVLELTESVIMADPEAARQIMADLHAAGIRLHIDDFGTGQSSLNALRSFPVDALKIDRSFVQALDVDLQTTELVQIIVDMGRALGLQVVAEGVETSGQADRLRAMGVETAQGWLYAEALPGAQARELLGSATVRATVSATVSSEVGTSGGG